MAPIRIADNGGWTDTWFAQHGKIFNIDVYPYSEAQIEVFRAVGEPKRIVVEAENSEDGSNSFRRSRGETVIRFWRRRSST